MSKVNLIKTIDSMGEPLWINTSLIGVVKEGAFYHRIHLTNGEVITLTNETAYEFMDKLGAYNE